MNSTRTIMKVDSALMARHTNNPNRKLVDAVHEAGLLAVHHAAVGLSQIRSEQFPTTQTDEHYTHILFALQKPRDQQQAEDSMHRLSYGEGWTVVRAYSVGLLIVNMMYTRGRKVPGEEGLRSEISDLSRELIRIASA